MKERIPVTVFVQISDHEPEISVSPCDKVEVRLVPFNWDTFKDLRNLPQLYTMRNEVESLPNSMAEQRDDVLEEINAQIAKILKGKA
jgi:hypothetical protein